MTLDNNKAKKFIRISVGFLGTIFVGLSFVARIKKSPSVYDDSPEEKNPFEGKKVVFVKNNNENYRYNS